MPRLSRLALLLAAGLALVALLGAVTTASAKKASNDTAPVVHVGVNPLTCGTAAGANSGVANVHFNAKKERLRINISVHNAQPNTSYLVSTRCINFLGTLTTNSEGTGTAHFRRENLTVPPAGPFFIDVSFAGDTFIAGPFDLD